MQLSSAPVGTLFRFVEPTTTGNAFAPAGEHFVVSRYAEDRVSGGTTIRFEGGGEKTFIWDQEDPEVEVTGKGRMEVKIIREE